MRINAIDYFDRISEIINEPKQEELSSIFEAVDFKLKRNNYHFSNIQRLLLKSEDLQNNDYYDDIYMPIYYEIEGFMVSLRSSVDIILHLINRCFELNIANNSVYLHNVYHHENLPVNIKNIFQKYTRPYNNPVWNFIYNLRNEVVHEKSVDQVLPIRIDMFLYQTPTLFLTYENKDKELTTFFNNCLMFLERLCSRMLQAIEVTLKQRL